MRHEQHRDAKPPLQGAQLHAHALAQLGVEIAERLVEQEQLGLVDDGARQCDPLLLPATQLGRPAAAQAAQPNQVEHARHPVAQRGAAHAAQLQRKSDVVEDGHVRPDGVALKDHAQVALLGRQRETLLARSYQAAGQVDRAAFRLLQTRHDAQRGALATAARPQQGEDIAWRDGQTQAVDGGHRPELAPHVAQLQDKLRARVGLPPQRGACRDHTTRSAS